MGNFNDLLGKCGFVVLNFVEALEITFGGIFWVADLTSSATNEIVRSIIVANEACAHHESSEVADVK